MIGVPSLKTFNLVQQLRIGTGIDFSQDIHLPMDLLPEPPPPPPPPPPVCIPQLQLRNDLQFHNDLHLLDFFCNPPTEPPVCVPQLQLRDDLQLHDDLQLLDFLCD